MNARTFLFLLLFLADRTGHS